MGSGYKNFEAGNVLAAADVDGYLMRQTVMTFASSAARDTALAAVLDEGMVAYLEDTDLITVYNGSAWVDILGVYQTWTPVWTNVTVGNGTTSAWYVRQGDLVHCELWFTLGSTSAITGSVTLEYPVAAHGDRLAANNMNILGRDGTGLDVPGQGRNNGLTPDEMVVSFINTSGTYADLYQMSATVPFTWANGDEIKVSGTYRAA